MHLYSMYLYSFLPHLLPCVYSVVRAWLFCHTNFFEGWIDFIWSSINYCFILYSTLQCTFPFIPQKSIFRYKKKTKYAYPLHSTFAISNCDFKEVSLQQCYIQQVLIGKGKNGLQYKLLNFLWFSCQLLAPHLNPTIPQIFKCFLYFWLFTRIKGV